MAWNNLRISQGLEILHGKINLKYFRGREGEVRDYINIPYVKSFSPVSVWLGRGCLFSHC